MIIRNEPPYNINIYEDIYGRDGGDCWGSKAVHFKKYNSIVEALENSIKEIFNNRKIIFKFNPDFRKLSFIIKEKHDIKIKRYQGFYGNYSYCIDNDFKINKLYIFYLIHLSENKYTAEFQTTLEFEEETYDCFTETN